MCSGKGIAEEPKWGLRTGHERPCWTLWPSNPQLSSGKTSPLRLLKPFVSPGRLRKFWFQELPGRVRILGCPVAMRKRGLDSWIPILLSKFISIWTLTVRVHMSIVFLYFWKRLSSACDLHRMGSGYSYWAGVEASTAVFSRRIHRLLWMDLYSSSDSSRACRTSVWVNWRLLFRGPCFHSVNLTLRRFWEQNFP